MAETAKPDPGIPWYRRPSGVVVVHTLRVTVLGFLAGAFAATFALSLEVPWLVLSAAFIVGLFFGALSATGSIMPPDIRGRYRSPLLFFWLLFPAFFPFVIVLSLSDVILTTARFLPALYIMGLILGFICREQRRPDRVTLGSKERCIAGVLLVLLAAFVGFGAYQDARYAHKRGHGFERAGGFSSTDLKPYDPRVPNAVTPRLEGPSAFVVGGVDNLPVLDGAEAAFPVYAAFAAACYPDLPPLSEKELSLYDYRDTQQGVLTFTNTIYGFRRLVHGKVDIFFGAHPSKEQMAEAASAGKELILTPIAREAFVFFVNRANPLDGLTSRQIRDIYSGKVRNWKELGGGNAEIIAFQRPEGSGSQTVMLRFMGDSVLEPPLRDRMVGGMGGIVEKTSEYRNAPSALGYSFRFFLAGMRKQPRIKTLALDGVNPTPETIRSGEYPHMVHLYAISLKDAPNPNVTPFLEWMQGEQGQELVEKVGYVRLR